MLHVAPPLQYVCFLGNIWDAEPLGTDDAPDTVVVASNVLLPPEDFEKSLAADPTGADVLATAGLQLAFTDSLARAAWNGVTPAASVACGASIPAR